MSEIIRSPSAHRTMWKSLGDKVYRHAYAIAHIGDFLAMQIFSMRCRRGWTQSRLARESGLTQPQVSKLEASCESVTLTTLHRIAEANDVALVVKFVPFSQLAREAIYSRADAIVPSFDEDCDGAITYSALMPDSVGTTMRPPARSAWTGTQGYVRPIDVTSSRMREAFTS